MKPILVWSKDGDRWIGQALYSTLHAEIIPTNEGQWRFSIIEETGNLSIVDNILYTIETIPAPLSIVKLFAEIKVGEYIHESYSEAIRTARKMKRIMESSHDTLESYWYALRELEKKWELLGGEKE